MKIKHLTFGQLFRLQSIQNLMRLTQRYHTRLEQAWESHGQPRYSFMVWKAERTFLEIARFYKPVIEFIRGPEVRRALRIAADSQPIQITPGYWKPFRDVTRWSQGMDSMALARLTADFCNAAGCPTKISRSKHGFLVSVETNDIGTMILRYRTGVSYATLRRYCEDGNLDFDRLFWWLPAGDKTGWRINPCTQPVNTPDIYEYAKALIFVEDNAPSCA